MKYSIPFVAEIGELGLSKAQGLINYSEKEGLCIEFETKDSILGIIKSPVKQVVLYWDDIASIEVKKKWFSAQIRIRATSMQRLKGLPSENAAEFVATIKKEFVEQALSLRSELLLLISEKKIEQLDSLHD